MTSSRAWPGVGGRRGAPHRGWMTPFLFDSNLSRTHLSLIEAFAETADALLIIQDPFISA